MGRTYLAETAVQQYVDSLLSLHDSAVGLIVGQVTIANRCIEILYDYTILYYTVNYGHRQ